MLWKISWRNILRHKGKSFVIGIILLFGAFVMTLGNGIILGARKGIEENLVNRFTGHFVIVSGSQKTDNIFFNSSPLEVVPDYEKVKNILDNTDYIQSYLPMTKGIALLLGMQKNFQDMARGVLIIGTNIDDYQKFFSNNVEILEGETIKNNQKGILVSTGVRDLLYSDYGIWIVPHGFELVEANLTPEAKMYKKDMQIKDNLVLVGFGESSYNTDIRLPITGVMKFKTLNNLWEIVCIMDQESFKECFGYFVPNETENKLAAKEQNVFNFTSEDDIFSKEEIINNLDITNIKYDENYIKDQVRKDNVEERSEKDVFNLISVKIAPSISVSKAKLLLEKKIAEENLNVKIIPGKRSTGQIAQLIDLIQGAIIIFVFLLFFVALLIITNTLSMATYERVEEIGMMRAIGTTKSFIKKMFFTETFINSFICGGLGIILGIAAILLISALNIPAGDNEMLYLLYGGDTFKPLINISVIIGCLIQLVVVTFIAVIYPIILSSKITPLEAISRN